MIIKKQCTRFKNFQIPDKFTEQNAVVYLELRDQNCPKQLAKKFCSKPVCRFDSTQKKDGPTKFRVLQVKAPKNYATYFGWQFSKPEYILPDNKINCLTQFHDRASSKNIEMEKQLNHNCTTKISQWEAEERVKSMYDYELDKAWGVDLREENKIKLLREKSITQGHQNTEFFYKNQKFQAISNLLMRDRIDDVQNQNKNPEFQSFSFFDPILSNPDLQQVKIQHFNKKEKHSNSASYQVIRSQESLQVIRSQESLPINFSNQMGKEDLYNMISEQSDDEFEDQVMGYRKKRIKDVLTYGFKQRKTIRLETPASTTLRNTTLPECTELIHNYLNVVNSKDKYSQDNISDLNIQVQVRQRQSMKEQAMDKFKMSRSIKTKKSSPVKSSFGGSLIKTIASPVKTISSPVKTISMSSTIKTNPIKLKSAGGNKDINKRILSQLLGRLVKL